MARVGRKLSAGDFSQVARPFFKTGGKKTACFKEWPAIRE